MVENVYVARQTDRRTREGERRCRLMDELGDVVAVGAMPIVDPKQVAPTVLPVSGERDAILGATAVWSRHGGGGGGRRSAPD